MTTPSHAPRRRSGFSLTELMVVVVMMAIIGTLLTTILMRQQRFHRTIENVVDARARMRDVATIFPTDIRSVSTAENDILAFGKDTLQFRSFTGTSVLCEFIAADTKKIGIPPKVLASGNVLTAWINPPAHNDLAYVYDDGAAAGNADDSWTRFTVDTTYADSNSTWCASSLSPAYAAAADNGHERYRLKFTTIPSQVTIKRGAVIRFAKEVRYSGYQASDNLWYVAYQACTPDASATTAGTCGAKEILAGPIKPITTDTTTSGLVFRYWNRDGTEVTAVANILTIARITVKIRTASESMQSATATKVGSSFTGGDSLQFTIGVRNRQ
jgi:prepilin-type N-terminal cleavage/methylation domain-containing protein